MNITKNKFINNMSFAFLANLTSLLVSTVLILIVPKFIGVSSYGYFQLYLFYTTYISYMSLGITDGIYLRLGGKEYNEIDKEILSGQFWFLLLFNFFVNLSFSYFYSFSTTNIDKINIIYTTAIVGILVVPRSLITFVLQATNRIKEFSMIIIFEKIIYFLLVIIILFMKISNYKFIVLADLIGKVISFIYAVYVCKDIVFSKFASGILILKEIKINFNVGIKLFISNLSSMMIIGIVRFFIEKEWDIETFGKVSLSLSISNMVIVFINAVAVVLFPALRKLKFETQKLYYTVIRSLLMPILLLGLLMYQPMILIFGKYLPMYVDSFKLMSLLFPMIIFEGKTVVLVNTYLKTLRKERVMLKVNLAIVFLSLFLSFYISYFLKNLNIMVLLILVLLVLRNTILEIYLSKILEVSVWTDMILEIALTLIFITSSFLCSSLISFFIFLAVYLIYIWIKKSDILESFRVLKYSTKFK